MGARRWGGWTRPPARPAGRVTGSPCGLRADTLSALYAGVIDPIPGCALLGLQNLLNVVERHPESMKVTAAAKAPVVIHAKNMAS